MKKGLIYPLLIVICICGWGTLSCKNKTGEKELAVTGTPQGKPEGSSPGAVVNGEAITLPEINQATRNILTQFQGQIPPEEIEQFRAQLQQQALENLINMKLLLQEANREGIQLEEKAVTDRIAEIAGRFPSPEKFKEQLEASGISEKELRREIETGLKIEALLDRQAPEGKKASEEEIEKFYRDNPENFRTPERVQASHILISVKPDESPEDKEAKRLKLIGLKNEIEAGGDFAKLAQEHSTCPSKDRGGDLGYIERGQMVKPFEDAAFTLEVGKISDIVETDFGYHLIKVTDYEEEEEIPLGEVRDKIAVFLKDQQRQEAIGDYLARLRGSATIEYAEGFKPAPAPRPEGTK